VLTAPASRERVAPIVFVRPQAPLNVTCAFGAEHERKRSGTGPAALRQHNCAALTVVAIQAHASLKDAKAQRFHNKKLCVFASLRRDMEKLTVVAVQG
jgi:hypothetical protein